MKVSDYIIDFFYKIGIKDYFGYQGTMIAYFIDSIGKNSNVNNHVCYNEQGGALAAVGYAKASGKPVCAYSTSGPGATNLITGIADAYYDSVPVIFITGQLNSFEYSNISTLRQQGFQETNIVELVKPITKYATQVKNALDICFELEKAISIANNERPGPVLIDIPMDIQKAEIDVSKLRHFNKIDKIDSFNYTELAINIIEKIEKSKRPILMLGNGIGKHGSNYKNINKLVNKLKIPVLYSMLAKSLIPDINKYNFGFMGTAYGERFANIIGCKKADLIVSLGCRMNGRTIGLNRKNFNSNSKIIRIDIDKNELMFKIHDDDENYICDVNKLIEVMNQVLEGKNISEKKEWLNVCNIIKSELKDIDKNIPEYLPNKYMEIINEYADENTNIFSDVGQNQIWAAHSIKIKENQKIIFSGGLGAMGFALPASIGGCIANNRKKTFVIVGDGGMQMNIQELQMLAVEKLPIIIFLFNNQSLGLIHQQQCDFFENKFYGACEEGGYQTPDFYEIAKAYKLDSYRVENLDEFKELLSNIEMNKPTLIEIRLNVGTKAYPKTHFGNEMINQKPELNEDLLNKLLKL